MIDLTAVDYRLTLLPPSGSKIDVTNLVLAAQHEEMKGEAAARLTVDIKNIKRADGWIHQHVFLANRLILEATDGGAWKEIFRGSVERWKTIADDHTVNFVAYDPVYAILQSKDHYYFKDGMTAAGSIKQIANEWGIPLGRVDGPGVSLTKKMYNGYIGDTMAKRIEESKEKGSGNFIVRSTSGKLEVIKEGSGSASYELTDRTVESSSDERSIESLVTKVKIYGNEKGDARPKVEASVNGRVEFGVRQEILYKSDFDNMGAATTAANAIIKEKGIVEVNRPLSHPDIPWIRKGDIVAVASGTIGGPVKDGNQGTIDCIVESVSRDLQSRMMTLRLKG